MKVDYSILLLGYIYDNHTIRFVRNLKRENPQIQIDCFGIKKEQVLPNDYLSCVRDFKVFKPTKYLQSLPGLRSFELIINLKKHFRDFIKGRHYDIVQIHYPEYMMSYLIRELRSVGDKIVLTPWGSDVYRISESKRKIVQKLYDQADYVTGAGDRFTQDFKRIFNIPDNKLAIADLGSETIDYISEHASTITTERAKQKLGVENNYVISCGYNASVGQQHERIIESIDRVKGQLPSNLLLLFPVTYPKNPVYIENLKKTVEEKGLKSKWFEDYLDLESLFELQMATDLFIHVQTTDANSTSLKEYILCKKNCINGGWLEYDDIEGNDRKPYYVVDDLDCLDEVIVYAYLHGAPKVSDQVMKHIRSLGCKPAATNWNRLFISICQ